MPSERFLPAPPPGLPACVWIIRFDAAGAASPGDAADVTDRANERQGFIWLHLDRADHRIRDVLKGIPTLNAAAVEALCDPADHQFVEHGGDLVSGAVVDHQHGLDGAKAETDFLRFALGERILVTSRRSPLYSADATRKLLATGARMKTPLELFEALISAISDCSGKMMRDLASSLDEIEDNVVIEGRGRDQRGRLGRARREVTRLARQVTGLQSTLQRLEEAAREAEHEILSDLAASLSQRAESLSRDATNLQDRARMLQEEINAILTLETNDRLYILTIVTAALLPATFVTGYFGMNTKQLLFFEDDNGTIYATLLCMMASVGALLLMRWFGLTASADRAEKDGSRAK